MFKDTKYLKVCNYLIKTLFYSKTTTLTNCAIPLQTRAYYLISFWLFCCILYLSTKSLSLTKQ